jgi:NADH-quinone oxidoreductase subunit J
MDITLSELLEPLVFYLISFIAVASAILVIAQKSIFRSGLFLILCLFCIAGLFITLDAEFLAAVQVLIYIGAIAVLILFAIMLTRKAHNPEYRQRTRSFLLGAFVSALLLFFLILVVGKLTLPEYPDVSAGEVEIAKVEGKTEEIITKTPDTTETIGEMLLSYYLLPFEIVSVLLLGAIIGAIVIARKEDKV